MTAEVTTSAPFRHRSRALRSLRALLATALVATSLGAGVSVVHAQDSVDTATVEESERIIVGPVRAHSFQRAVPDDAGVDVDPSKINLAALLEALGPDARQWYQHVMTLSNPFFEGRAPGTAGNRVAAEYIEFWFRRFGLEPAFPGSEAGTDADAVDASAPDEALVESGADVTWTTYRQPFNPRDRENLATENVGGVLRGKGDLADEWIVIGAHYDHVGYGRPGASVEGGTVYTGADDNASGTSGVLVLAERLCEAYAEAGDDADLRSILFMAFSAEEMGLLGAGHYVSHPTLDAEQIMLMINLDMIGRLRKDSLMVQGVGTAAGLLDRIRPHLLESGLTIYADPSGRGPSDHARFFGVGIPVLFMFTGVHDVYHRPGDQGYTINPQGAIRIINLVEDIAWDMATAGEALVFTQPETPAGGGRRAGGRGGNRVTLGILPKFGSDQPGVAIDRVFDDGPAAKAGLKPGDIIAAWNGDPIEGGRDLMTKLRDAESGDEVKLTIKRNDETLTLKVTLG